MKKIYKYTLELTDTQPLYLPKGAQILSVAEQRGQLCLWALVAPHETPEQRSITIVGTGNPIFLFEKAKFIGTVLCNNGFVWHVFEE